MKPITKWYLKHLDPYECAGFLPKPDGCKRILGFDASTKTIGVALIDYQPHWVTGNPSISLVFAETYSPPQKGNIFDRLEAVKQKIAEYIDAWKPDDVALEDIILFMKGRSTAKTVTSLAVLNRTVGLTALEMMHKPPTLLNVMSIRHSLKLDKELPSKEQIPDLVAHHLGIDFPWILNKKGEQAVESYDMADGMAVALSFIVLSDKPPKKKKKVAKKRKKVIDGSK